MSAFTASPVSQDTFSTARHFLTGAAVVVLDDPVPIVKTAGADALGTFIRHGCVDRPGAYVAFWNSPTGTTAYVGQSGVSVASRLRDPKFRLFARPARVVTVTDDQGSLSPAQARAVERILHLTLVASGVRILGDIPAGAVVTDTEYGMLRHFCAGAIRQMQEAHLAFDSLPQRLALAGPVTEPGVVLGTVPQGRTFRLETRHAVADLVETPNDFVIVPGSTIRDPGFAPETRSIGVLRQELTYAGILMREGSESLLATKPLRLATASAATRLVTGATAGIPGLWKPIDEDGRSLRRVPKVIRATPILQQITSATNESADSDATAHADGLGRTIGGLSNG
ncbi:MAG: hypothetical protein GX458_03405 [Phyllobacteriaceae bacterium]|nr:hypothetical protein [Phyllobacteriaceae bacterium]